MFDFLDFIFDNWAIILFIIGAILGFFGKEDKKETKKGNQQQPAPKKQFPDIDWPDIFEKEMKRIPKFDWKEVFEKETKPGPTTEDTQMLGKETEQAEAKKTPAELENPPISEDVPVQTFAEETQASPLEEQKKHIIETEAQLKKIEEKLKMFEPTPVLAKKRSIKTAQYNYFRKLTNDDIVRGVIWAEILDKPRAKRPLEKVYRYKGYLK